MAAQLRARLVHICTIQFGWQCRDGTFSVEYEKPCYGIARLGFDDARHQFRLRIHEEEQNLIIAIRASQITTASLAVDSTTDESIISLTLSYPAAYESEPSTSIHHDDMLDLFDMPVPRSSPGPRRRRLSSLDEEHHTYAAYTSLSLRIVCEGRHSADNFR